MKKALQESMRNLSRFGLDFCFIWEGFSTYFGSQRASKINQNSDRGLERPLETSGVAFGRPLSRIGASGGRNCPKKLWAGGMRGGPLSVEISTEFDRPIQSRPAPPKGGGGSSPMPPRIPPNRPQKSGAPPLFDVQNRFQNFIRFLKVF